MPPAAGLAMLALAFLAVLAAIDRRQDPPDGMIPLTPSKICHLLSVLAAPPARDPRHWLNWPGW
ncbi:MAG: hypothetical protein M3Y33_05315 [Actinomycetota bacterium]|nr:hypothetical protein [Actinomycetota bacterium]